MKLVLLPGLDGTGLLFEPLLRVLPSHFAPLVISYPANEPLSYAQLLPLVRASLPVDEDYILLAESFSGPIAVELAASDPPRLKALILCATFLSNPACLSDKFSTLVRPIAFTLEFPEFVVRRYLLGRDAPAYLVEDFRRVSRSVSPEVLAFRMRSVMHLNAQDALKECRVPIVYLAARHDKLIGKQCLAEMRRIQPQMEVVEIDGPHFLLQSEPQNCVRAIDQFLSQAVRPL